MDDNSIEGIAFEERTAGPGLCVAFARLVAERSLNALTQTMIDGLQARLAAWADRDDVVCVVIHGAGERAFCAGGDVIGLYRAMTAAGGAPSAEAERLFAAEYRLDHTVHRYPKPILVWGHGTVMGGGLGLLAGASHRIVTETSRLAMPEVTIGLFPDVGASWFLGRMPQRIGLFLGLTTTPVTAGDALCLGLADHGLENGQREAVFDALTSLPWQGSRRSDDGVLTAALREFEQAAARDPDDTPVWARRSRIARIADAADVAAFERRLQAAAEGDDWFAHGARALAGASPTSLVLTHRQLARDPRLSIEAVFRCEYAMAVACTRGPDFAEGIRARLVDKDRQPQWSPAYLAAVDPARVAAHFALPGDYHHHPLADL